MASISVFWIYQNRILGQIQRQDEGVQGLARAIDSTLEHAIL